MKTILKSKKKPVNKQVQESYIMVPDKLTAKQKKALSAINTILGYEEVSE
jgi:hypothetical protein